MPSRSPLSPSLPLVAAPPSVCCPSFRLTPPLVAAAAADVRRVAVLSLQTLAHTAMVVAAMTAHGDVVTWCVAHTAARPWVVAKALVCTICRKRRHISITM